MVDQRIRKVARSPRTVGIEFILNANSHLPRWLSGWVYGNAATDAIASIFPVIEDTLEYDGVNASDQIVLGVPVHHFGSCHEFLNLEIIAYSYPCCLQVRTRFFKVRQLM